MKQKNGLRLFKNALKKGHKVMIVLLVGIIIATLFPVMGQPLKAEETGSSESVVNTPSLQDELTSSSLVTPAPRKIKGTDDSTETAKPEKQVETETMSSSENTELEETTESTMEQEIVQQSEKLSNRVTPTPDYSIDIGSPPSSGPGWTFANNILEFNEDADGKVYRIYGASYSNTISTIGPHTKGSTISLIFDNLYMGLINKRAIRLVFFDEINIYLVGNNRIHVSDTGYGTSAEVIYFVGTARIYDAGQGVLDLNGGDIAMQGNDIYFTGGTITIKGGQAPSTNGVVSGGNGILAFTVNVSGNTQLTTNGGDGRPGEYGAMGGYGGNGIDCQNLLISDSATVEAACGDDDGTHYFKPSGANCSKVSITDNATLISYGKNIGVRAWGVFDIEESATLIACSEYVGNALNTTTSSTQAALVYADFYSKPLNLTHSVLIDARNSKGEEFQLTLPPRTNSFVFANAFTNKTWPSDVTMTATNQRTNEFLGQVVRTSDKSPLIPTSKVPSGIHVELSPDPIFLATPATDITHSSAKLNGIFHLLTYSLENGRYEFGQTTSYGTNHSWTKTYTGSGKIESQQVDKLDSNTRYHYRVSGTTTKYPGVWVNSSDETFVTLPLINTITSAPTSETTATVTGTIDAQTNGENITEIEVDYATDANFTSGLVKLTGTSSGVTYNKSSYTVDLSSLVKGTTYHVRVRVKGPGGWSAYKTTSIKAGIPEFETLPAENITDNAATLKGKYDLFSYQFQSGASGRYEYGKTASFGTSSTWTPTSLTGAGNAPDRTVSGLSPNTKYYYRVGGLTTLNNNYLYGSSQIFYTLPKVKTVTASPTSGTTVKIEGTLDHVSGSETITDVEIQYATDNTFTTILNTLNKSSGVIHTDSDYSAQLTGLTEGSTYYLRVRAQGAGGWSAYETTMVIMPSLTLSVNKTTPVFSSVKITAAAENKMLGGKINGYQWLVTETTDSTDYSASADFAAKYALAIMTGAGRGIVTNQNQKFYPSGTTNGTYWVKVLFEDGNGVKMEIIKSIKVTNIYTQVSGHYKGVNQYETTRILYDDPIDALKEKVGIAYELKQTSTDNSVLSVVTDGTNPIPAVNNQIPPNLTVLVEGRDLTPEWTLRSVPQQVPFTGLDLGTVTFEYVRYNFMVELSISNKVEGDYADPNEKFQIELFLRDDLDRPYPAGKSFNYHIQGSTGTLPESGSQQLSLDSSLSFELAYDNTLIIYNLDGYGRYQLSSSAGTGYTKQLLQTAPVSFTEPNPALTDWKDFDTKNQVYEFKHIRDLKVESGLTDNPVWPLALTATGVAGVGLAGLVISRRRRGRHE